MFSVLFVYLLSPPILLKWISNVHITYYLNMCRKTSDVIQDKQQISLSLIRGYYEFIVYKNLTDKKIHNIHLWLIVYT